MTVANFQPASEVLCHWQAKIGAVDQIKLTHEMPEGFQVTTFFVETDRQERFVLKNVLGGPNATRLDAEYQLLQYLQQYGVPVAVPVLADEGQLAIEKPHGIYLLYPILPTDEDDSVTFDVRSVYTNVGNAIARLHKVLASYPGRIDSWTMNLPRTLAEEAIPQIQQALQGEALSRFDRTFAALQPELNSALTGLPTHYIHGDCHGGNILLYRGEVSGFIDLDHLPVGPRVYDIGYYLADRAKARFVGNIADARWEHDQWLDNFTHVIAGYERVTQLSAQERHALGYIMLATQLMFAYWLFKYESTDAAQQNLAAFYWLCERKTEILARIDNPARRKEA